MPPWGLGGMVAGQFWARAVLPTALRCHTPKQEPGTASHLNPQAPWLRLRSPKQPVRKPLGSWGSGVAASVYTSHPSSRRSGHLGHPKPSPYPHTSPHRHTRGPSAPTPRESFHSSPSRPCGAVFLWPWSPHPVSPSFGTTGIVLSACELLNLLSPGICVASALRAGMVSALSLACPHGQSPLEGAC